MLTVDNQTCITLSKHSLNHKSRENLHLLQDLFEKLRPSLKYVPIENMPADAIIKLLQETVFRDL